MLIRAKHSSPDFIISTGLFHTTSCALISPPNAGDNFYSYGLDSDNDRQFVTSFQSIYRADEFPMPWYIVLGNHDYRGSTDAQLHLHQHDPRWNLPSLFHVKRFQFSDRNQLHSVCFLFIDTSPFISRYYTSSIPQLVQNVRAANVTEQLLWIQSKLSGFQETCAWRFVVGHHPAYSGGEHGNNQEIIDMLTPIFESFNVDFYLTGHDHDLQHLRANGIDYIVSGAGSTVRPNLIKTPYTVCSHRVLAWYLIKVC